MDKYEYNLKLDQMKSLVAEGHYQAAAEIADTINWRKIKNVTALVRAGEIYEQVGRYEESREVLLMAYDRSPIGRAIIYRLACVTVKMAKYDEAKEYYKEFVEIAPHDNLKYVLKYEINKAEGADYQTLIANLEDLKEQEFSEEWGYELAYLYHQAGMSEQCIEACDELVLYFGQGSYVEKALELKMLYQPLTPQQEEKYRQFRNQKEGIVEVRPEDALESGEIVTQAVQIPEIEMSPERFNTQSLQDVLQESMQIIMSATEQETVEEHMDTIKKLVEDIPYLQMPEEEEEEPEIYIPTNKEMEDTLRLNFQEILTNEEYDGQMRIVLPGGKVFETQVTKQMTMEEVINEWERIRQAAETALMEANEMKLKSVKTKALQETADIMERLADVIPKLESGNELREPQKKSVLAVKEPEKDKAAKMVANMNQLLQKEIERLSTENAQIEEKIAVAQEQAANQELAVEQYAAAAEQTVFEEGNSSEESLAEKEVFEPKEAFNEEAFNEETFKQETFKEETFKSEEIQEVFIEPEVLAEEICIKEIPTEEISLEEIPLPELSFEEEVQEALGVVSAKTEPEEDFLANISEELAGLLKESKREFAFREAASEESLSEEVSLKEILPKEIVCEEIDSEEVSLEEIDLQEIEPEEIFSEEEFLEEMDLEIEITELSEEQKEMFSYIIPIKGMEEQICKALSGIASRLSRGGDSTTGNLIVQGGSGSGKTVFATNFIKVLQQITDKPDGKVGKIEASILNQKDVNVLFGKITGGCLIVESAGDLAKETTRELSLLLEQDKQGTLVILEDSKHEIEKVLVQDKRFASKFSERINIPIFTNDELVIFAKAYAAENGYVIDEMGILALYNCISNIQKLDKETTIAEVKEIVDEAITNAERGALKIAFSILTSSRFDEDDYVILQEKDFNN